MAAKGGPKWAAGVFLYNMDTQRVLAVSRNGKPRKSGRMTPVDRLDWGLPGGLPEVAEPPQTTAVRELWEETGLFLQPAALQYALTVPAELSGRRTYQVFTPRVAPGGAQPPLGISVRGTEGYVRWVTLPQLTRIVDPDASVADSNRYILYYLLGVDVPVH